MLLFFFLYVFLPCFVSVHFCSVFVICAKGQQFKREMDKWAAVWKYLLVSFSWGMWLFNLLPFPGSLHAGEYIHLDHQGRVSQWLEYMLRHLKCGFLRCFCDSWKRAGIRLVRVIWITPELGWAKGRWGKDIWCGWSWEAAEICGIGRLRVVETELERVFLLY